MLSDRNSTNFLFGSLQLYGPVSDDMFRLAKDILKVTPSRSKENSKAESLDAKSLAAKAEIEFAYYRRKYPEFRAKVEVSSRIAGIMVSGGKLLINEKLVTPLARVDALLQHEVGTHLLTYFNGLAQPFRQLSSGLAGYDELQEGLAVVAEYLVGGLSRPRIRQLAARVVAAKLMSEGATFIDTFRALDRNYDFSQPVAYNVTMRVFRAGGLTKDAVYLRGLRKMLQLLRDGTEIETLLIGKFAAEHIPIIKELQLRRVIHAPPLLPRYFDRNDVTDRLKGLVAGMTVVDLVKRG
jgi:uncharacterized protein (TIGR02421 family)